MQTSNLKRMLVEALDFGVTADTPVVNFVSAIDLDKSIIRIPYLDFQTSVKSIIENYLEITSCRDKFKDKPCLRIFNGLFEGDIAVDSFKISGMNINLQEICFEIVDRASLDMEGSITSTLKKVEKANSNNIIPVQIIFNGKKIEMQINLRDTPVKLKNLLVATKIEFSSYSAESIRLQYNGLFLSNDKLIESYNITPNSRIMALVSKKQGCFSAETLVSCPNNIKKTISSLKKGDQILSFNVASKQLEVDVVTHSLNVSLDQCVQIKLEDGTVIETTTNHTFLCDDMSWRKVDCAQKSPQKLIRGCRLWRQNAEALAVVVDIKMKSLPAQQSFYHLSIEKNHNFLVEGIVAHNMFVNIRLSDTTEKIDINPTSPFIEVKKALEQTYHVDRLNMRLIYAGMEIRDEHTASDKNIGKDSTLNLVTKLSKKREYENGLIIEKEVDLGYSYLHPDTKILMGNNTYKPICQIEQGDEVASFNTQARTALPNASIVQQITKFEVKEYFQIYLDSGKKSVTMSRDSFIELYNGQAIHTKDLLNEYSQSGRPNLQKFSGGIIKAHAISPDSYKDKTVFYRLTLDNSQNYVAEDIIIHRSVISLLSVCNENRGSKIRYGVDGETSISEIKQKLHKLTGLAPAKQIFTFNGMTITPQKTIMDIEIRNEHIIVVSQAQNMVSSMIMVDNEQQAENIEEKKLTLQISQTEKMVIRYVVYAEKTIQEIMREILPNYRSSYFFLFSDLILLPEQRLNEIQKTIEFKLSELTIIVVKNQKFAFVQKMSLQSSSIRTFSHIYFNNPNNNSPPPPLGEPNSPADREAFQRASSRIAIRVKQSEYKNPSFFYPFLYFTCGSWNNDLNKCVRGLDVDPWERNLTKSLYVNMQALQNFVGDCCLGMKNFKFSSFFSIDQTFYFHNFTLAHKKEKDIALALNGKPGTLFYISSLSGKQIDKFSLYPEDQEVLFSPYSYFLVEKIEIGYSMDRVWLKEMPSPTTFQKNIVLWVDDNPINNKGQIDLILNSKNIEIIQATSTFMAEKWVKQFGWLLKWKGLDFKLVSDMGRIEGPNKVNNPQAGLDLLDKLYVQHGITAKTLIFCGNQKRGKKLAAERSIKSKNYDITDNEKVLEAFFNDYQ